MIAFSGAEDNAERQCRVFMREGQNQQPNEELFDTQQPK